MLALHLTLAYVFSLRLFVKRAVLFVAAFWCASVDVISGGVFFTSAFMAVCSLCLLVTSPLKISDCPMLFTGLIAAVFFSGMSEFKDGYALSHAAIAAAVAVYSYAVFSPSVRQSAAVAMLSAALLTTYSVGLPLRAYELLTAFLIVFALSESYLPSAQMPLSQNFSDKRALMSARR